MVDGKLVHFELLVCRIFVFIFIIKFYLALPNDFNSMQEEIERQKTALLDKTKRKETIETSGKIKIFFYLLFLGNCV